MPYSVLTTSGKCKTCGDNLEVQLHIRSAGRLFPDLVRIRCKSDCDFALKSLHIEDTFRLAVNVLNKYGTEELEALLGRDSI